MSRGRIMMEEKQRQDREAAIKLILFFLPLLVFLIWLNWKYAAAVFGIAAAVWIWVLVVDAFGEWLARQSFWE